MIYMDWAATAMPRKEILQNALLDSMDIYGNPSSQHQAGTEAKEVLDESRISIGKTVHCNSDNIYFTSGGSEANNIALLSFLKKHGTGEIITSSIEHPSISEPVSVLKNFGWKVKNINPGEDGLLPIKKIEKMINENTKVISIIWVHNETGVIQPVSEIVSLIRLKEMELNKKIHIHLDGVQAAGKINIDLEQLDIDSLSVSGHKFGGPKGVGLLYLKNSRDVLYRGGGQARGVRPGTENVFGIKAMSLCLEDSINNLKETASRLDIMMNMLIKGVREVGVITIPRERTLSDRNFIPNILSLSCPPLPGEVIARVLSEKGFMVSTGSACSSNKKSTTKGILSMGISEQEGFSSFRVSIGRLTTEEDIENFLKALKETIKELAP